MKKALTFIAASALFATPALAGDSYKMQSHSNMDSMSTSFSHYDTDNDGQVTFTEFSKHAKAMNMSTTKAAQLFTKMSGGSPTLMESNFQAMALSNPDSYLITTPNTAVLSSTSTMTTPTYGTVNTDMTVDLPTYSGMSIDPDAGIDATSPMTDMPSEMVLDGVDTYPDFERTGEYDEPLGN